uniref:Uncharacterized protein n=1 Tax=Biomphalaria glabrata TaxID=6526 RepID=A0A2C9LCB7_BIOGL
MYLRHVMAGLIFLIVLSDQASSAHAEDTARTCHPYTAYERTSVWWPKAQDQTEAARDPGPTGDMNMTVLKDIDEDVVVFTIEVQPVSQGKDIYLHTANYTVEEYILFLQCLSNFKVYFCFFPLQDVTDSKNQSLVLKPANFTNTSLSVTCGYNTNFSSIQCNKSDNSSATQLGIFNIDVHEANRTNITIFLNWKSSLKVTELRWADFLDVHFVCLADDKAGDLVKMSLPLQIAGAAMALVIIIMFTITVCRSFRRRRQLEEKLKLIPETEVELEHTKTFSSQIRLITDTTDIPVPEENTIVVKF